jgi:tetratricopeptide (TPR) repeat protein
MVVSLATLCALNLVFLVFLATPAEAQKGSPPPARGSSGSSGGTTPMQMPSIDNPGDAFARIYADPSPSLLPIDTSEMVNAEACNSWTESGVHSPTISVGRLAVPNKASAEYQKGCGAYKDKKLPLAEVHLRKAIEVYPSYVAAWVVLGQILDAQHKRDEARTACSQAATVDPNYVAPYLCLAEFAATENNWDEVSKLSQRALAIDPVNNIYSHYYAADAGIHLLHLADAETNAQAALQLDTWHHLPQLHLLLAQVYAAKGDVRSEVTNLKQYLKLAPNTLEASGAKDTLAQLETHLVVPAASK